MGDLGMLKYSICLCCHELIHYELMKLSIKVSRLSRKVVLFIYFFLRKEIYKFLTVRVLDNTVSRIDEVGYG